MCAIRGLAVPQYAKLSLVLLRVDLGDRAESEAARCDEEIPVPSNCLSRLPLPILFLWPFPLLSCFLFSHTFAHLYELLLIYDYAVSLALLLVTNQVQKMIQHEMHMARCTVMGKLSPDGPNVGLGRFDFEVQTEVCQ